MNHKNLSKNIIATIVYYDVLEYPMTCFEVWQHMINHRYANVTTSECYTLEDVVTVLDTLVASEAIAVYRGFYILPLRKDLVVKRLRRNRVTHYKLRRLRRVSRFLRLVPFVRGIFVTGRCAMHHAQSSSDLDVLIVLARGHIWTGRFLVTICTVVLGVRRRDRAHKDHVCLNYFVTDHSLEVPTRQLFDAHEYSWVFPLFGAHVFRRFQFANAWIAHYQSHYMVKDIVHTLCLRDTVFSRAFRLGGEKLFGFLLIENILRRYQKNKIQKNPRTYYIGAKIIANDDHLVFLPKPHSPRVEEEYTKRMANF